MPRGVDLFFESVKQDAQHDNHAFLPKYSMMIQYALHYNKPEILQRYRVLFPNTGEQVIHECRSYIAILNKQNIQKAFHYLEAKNFPPHLINLQNKNGATLLMLAAQAGHLPWIDALCKIPFINLNENDKQGATAILLAANTKKWLAVQALLKYQVDINAPDSYGESLIFLIIKNDHRALFETLLAHQKIDVKARDSQNNTPLILAARLGCEWGIQLLLKQKDIDINCHNRDGTTALIEAVKNQRWNIAELLLKETNINVNAKDAQGRSALMYTARYQNSVIFNLLRRKGGIVTEKDLSGKSALDYDRHYVLNLSSDDLNTKVGGDLKKIKEENVLDLFEKIGKELKHYKTKDEQKLKVLNEIKKGMPQPDAKLDQKIHFLKTLYVALKLKHGTTLSRYSRAPKKDGFNLIVNLIYKIHEICFGSRGKRLINSIFTAYDKTLDQNTLMKNHENKFSK